MPFYSITLEEFLTLYGDVPEARLMFDMPGDETDRRRADSDVTDAMELARRKQMREALSDNKHWKRKIQSVARKCGVCGTKEEDDRMDENIICQPEEGVDDDIDDAKECGSGGDSKRKSNAVGKAMRWLGQGMLKHFYFMSVAVESTGGIYMTTYQKSHDGSVISNLEFCYVSSYACTDARTTLVY